MKKNNKEKNKRKSIKLLLIFLVLIGGIILTVDRLFFEFLDVRVIVPIGLKYELGEQNTVLISGSKKWSGVLEFVNTRVYGINNINELYDYYEGIIDLSIANIEKTKISGINVVYVDYPSNHTMSVSFMTEWNTTGTLYVTYSDDEFDVNILGKTVHSFAKPLYAKMS